MQENNKIVEEEEKCDCPDFGYYILGNSVVCKRCNREKPKGYIPNLHLYKPLPAPSSTPQSVEGIREILHRVWDKRVFLSDNAVEQCLKAMQEYANQLVNKADYNYSLKLENEVEYWKARCEAAEAFADGEYWNKELYEKWQSLKNKKPE